MKIENITAREILDSRGNPTVSASVILENGVVGDASVPSGASTGSGEAYELRDGKKNRYAGLGVLKAVSNVEKIIGPELIGLGANCQKEIDKKMIELDGTENKRKLGANAILAVSLAVAKAAAISEEKELFEYLAELYGNKKLTIPTPMFNILNGGKHAENLVDVQETMIVPLGPKTFAEKLEMGSEIYHTLKKELIDLGYDVGLGDEGGFAPDFKSNEDVFNYVKKAIETTGYTQKDVRISADVAATELYDKKEKTYRLSDQKSPLSSADFIKKVTGWAKKYNLYTVEDGLAESDENWPVLTQKVSPTITIGDDLFTTNPKRIREGIKEKWAGGVIIKPNQIGTLTETLEAIRTAQKGKLKVIISHRSGETEDSFIADLAVAVGAELIKAGAPARSERLAKYNRLLRIEEILNEN